MVDDLVARDRCRAVPTKLVERSALARADSAGDRDGERAAQGRKGLGGRVGLVGASLI
jgi:hypothetical protein